MGSEEGVKKDCKQSVESSLLCELVSRAENYMGNTLSLIASENIPLPQIRAL